MFWSSVRRPGGEQNDWVPAARADSDVPGAVSHDQRFLTARHLPLDTDAVMAHAIEQGAEDGLPGGPAGLPLVAPALVYGASGEHAGWPRSSCHGPAPAPSDDPTPGDGTGRRAVHPNHPARCSDRHRTHSGDMYPVVRSMLCRSSSCHRRQRPAAPRVHPAKKTSSSVSAFISTWSPDGMVLQSAPASGGAEMPRVSRARALTVERRPGEGDRPGAVDREGVAEPASQGVAERAP